MRGPSQLVLVPEEVFISVENPFTHFLIRYKIKAVDIVNEIEEIAADSENFEPPLLLFDNARPHKAHLVSNKLEELGWETVSHPPYSPNLSPCDFAVFRSMEVLLAV